MLRVGCAISPGNLCFSRDLSFFWSREGRAISSGNLCFSPHLEKFGEVANLVARLKLDSTCMRASSYDA